MKCSICFSSSSFTKLNTTFKCKICTVSIHFSCLFPFLNFNYFSDYNNQNFDFSESYPKNSLPINDHTSCHTSTIISENYIEKDNTEVILFTCHACRNPSSYRECIICSQPSFPNNRNNENFKNETEKSLSLSQPKYLSIFILTEFPNKLCHLLCFFSLTNFFPLSSKTFTNFFKEMKTKEKIFKFFYENILVLRKNHLQGKQMHFYSFSIMNSEDNINSKNSEILKKENGKICCACGNKKGFLLKCFSCGKFFHSICIFSFNRRKKKEKKKSKEIVRNLENLGRIEEEKRFHHFDWKDGKFVLCCFRLNEINEMNKEFKKEEEIEKGFTNYKPLESWKNNINDEFNLCKEKEIKNVLEMIKEFLKSLEIKKRKDFGENFNYNDRFKKDQFGSEILSGGEGMKFGKRENIMKELEKYYCKILEMNVDDIEKLI